MKTGGVNPRPYARSTDGLCVSLRADVGIRPYARISGGLFVGGDAHIAPYAAAAPWHQASLCEGGGMAEGHAGGRDVTRNSLPPVGFADSPLSEGAKNTNIAPLQTIPGGKSIINQRPKAATYLYRSAAKARFDNRPTPRRVFPKREARTDRKPSKRKIV